MDRFWYPLLVRRGYLKPDRELTAEERAGTRVAGTGPWPAVFLHWPPWRRHRLRRLMREGRRVD
ncbi:MAG TPA: hypothetical protein VMV92_40535 [Streptosporangiaceae bacterium]|nr:hypothetical protein [Streptosporangiaceae bacterium]